jgi:hypothetical protein
MSTVPGEVTALLSVNATEKYDPIERWAADSRGVKPSRRASTGAFLENNINRDKVSSYAEHHHYNSAAFDFSSSEHGNARHHNKARDGGHLPSTSDHARYNQAVLASHHNHKNKNNNSANPSSSKHGRRASMSGMPSSQAAKPLMNSSSHAKKSRRASVSVIPYHQTPFATDAGYDTDDDARSHHSAHSLRRRASLSQRRASTGFSNAFTAAPPQNRHNQGIYGPRGGDNANSNNGDDTECEDGNNYLSVAVRTANYDGPIAVRRSSYRQGHNYHESSSRRSSYNGAQVSSSYLDVNPAMVSASRRGSANGAFMQEHGMVSRRASANGGFIDIGNGSSLALPQSRRASATGYNANKMSNQQSEAYLGEHIYDESATSHLHVLKSAASILSGEEEFGASYEHKSRNGRRRASLRTDKLYRQRSLNDSFVSLQHEPEEVLHQYETPEENTMQGMPSYGTLQSYNSADTDGSPTGANSAAANSSVGANSRKAQMSDDGSLDRNDAVDYGYGETLRHSHAYGYGYSAPEIQLPPNFVASRRSSRRNSFRSAASSQRSSRSRRRNSTVIHKHAIPMVIDDPDLGMHDEPPRVSDNDLENNWQAPEPSMLDHIAHRLAADQRQHGGSLLDSDSEHSRSTTYSNLSNRRTSRRNSCVVVPDKDPLAESLLKQAKRKPKKESNMLFDGEDLTSESSDDPDSLLRRSERKSTVATKKQPITPKATPKAKESVEGNDSVAINGANDSNSAGNIFTGAGQTASGKAQMSSKTIQTSDNVPKSSTIITRKPFTTPHVPLTAEALEENMNNTTHTNEAEDLDNNSKHYGMPKTAARGAWGDLDLSSEDSSSSSSDDSDEELINLYNDSPTIQEIDRFKQRARRRESIEESFYEIPDDTPTQNGRDVQNKSSSKNAPHFTPAISCNNASDFVVRGFTARLRSGIIVMKHNRSRWSKSSYRKLILLPDGKTLCWKPMEGEDAKGARRPKLDLTNCKEVRHAWSRDPDTRKLSGTAILRKRCKDGMASKSFALIFNKRTLDMTAVSNDQCKVLMEGFSALCYRLKLEQMKEREEFQSDDADQERYEGKSQFTDDDWASTVYGGPESTVSMTQTNTSSVLTSNNVINVPRWGL